MQYQLPTIRRRVDLIQGGMNTAESYPVNAGEEVILIDMDNPYVYRKARGFDNKLEPLQMFDLIPHVEKQEIAASQVNLDGYVKSDDVESMVKEKVEALVRDEVEKRMSEITFRPQRKQQRKDDE